MVREREREKLRCEETRTMVNGREERGRRRGGTTNAKWGRENGRGTVKQCRRKKKRGGKRSRTAKRDGGGEGKSGVMGRRSEGVE